MGVADRLLDMQVNRAIEESQRCHHGRILDTRVPADKAIFERRKVSLMKTMDMLLSDYFGDKMPLEEQHKLAKTIAIFLARTGV